LRIDFCSIQIAVRGHVCKADRREAIASQLVGGTVIVATVGKGGNASDGAGSRSDGLIDRDRGKDAAQGRSGPRTATACNRAEGNLVTVGNRGGNVGARCFDGSCNGRSVSSNCAYVHAVDRQIACVQCGSANVGSRSAGGYAVVQAKAFFRGVDNGADFDGFTNVCTYLEALGGESTVKQFHAVEV